MEISVYARSREWGFLVVIPVQGLDWMLSRLLIHTEATSEWWYGSTYL